MAHCIMGRLIPPYSIQPVGQWKADTNGSHEHNLVAPVRITPHELQGNGSAE